MTPDISTKLNNTAEAKNEYNGFMDKIPSLVALTTICGLVLSVFYNFGYFLPIGVEFLGYFSIQDYIEGSIPFLLTSGALIYIPQISIHLEYNFSTQQKFKEYSTALKEKQLFNKIIWLTPCSLIFLLSLTITEYVYSILFVQAYILTNIIHYPNKIFDQSSYIFAALLTIIILDILIRNIKTKHTKYIRMILLSCTFMALTGYIRIAQQIEAPNNLWTLYYSNQKTSENIILLRPLQNWLITYHPQDNQFNIIKQENIESVVKKPNTICVPRSSQSTQP